MFYVNEYHNFRMPRLAVYSCTFVILTVLVFSTAEVIAHEERGADTDSESLFVGMELEAAGVVKAFHAALNEGSSDSVLMALDSHVSIFEGGGVDRTAIEYVSGHMIADFEFMSGVDSSVLEHRVYESEEMAFSVTRTKYVGAYEGEPVNYTGVETLVLKKKDGIWKINHIHWSE
ncbi:YybH family protein [Congregibacter litoralis]|uniref:SnoaL-like domain protein n=1 Tax=Congregibacter litoralis KT71 TaxID=314285 RepID=A4ADY3_9GAMM|nr:nuclear transport factor 2 family protein [Congregibacter litoralis]EAQ95793.2 SnoaL-like domain protein [Congregibacter litoralis KT71]